MKVVSENNYVHYKCQLNSSSKHTARFKVEVTHRRAFFSSIAKFANKKNWLDAFPALTSCQCGFVCSPPPRAHPNYSLQADVKGRRKAEVKIQGVFWILVPRRWLQRLWWWPCSFHPYFAVHSSEAVLPLLSSHCFHHLGDGALLWSQGCVLNVFLLLFPVWE